MDYKTRINYIHKYIDDYRFISKYYHALDMYLVTSREEGGPKAVLESMATGVTIVSTPVGQGKDLIINGYNGWISNSFEPDELFIIVKKSLNYDYNDLIKINGRKTAENNSYLSQNNLWMIFLIKL